MESTLRARLRALGREIAPPLLNGTRALFGDRVEAPAPAHCRVLRDLAYGPDARHRLDLFMPAAPSARPCPVLVFVHGGGFVAGDKGGADEPFYANIGAWAARQGFIGANITYRLAPAAAWPAGLDDVGRAVDWLAAQVGAHGGDPAHIVLMGQSAGAVHVAGYLATLDTAQPPRVAGAILMSGLYDLVTLTHTPREHAYFGTDGARFAAQSPLPGLLRCVVPCLFTLAELDPPAFQRQAARLVDAHLEAHGRWPRLHWLHGHNHVSPVLAIGSPDDDVGPLLQPFVDRPAD